MKLHADEPTYYPDDIDHFGNRRVRSVGELIQNQVRVGLSRMERVVRERMTTQDVEAITPQTLINIRPVVAAIKEFFGSSQLSQFMDQTNPLAGLTHKRRLSALGPGGLSRERAGFEVRDVHPSHYGRMCPIETPEGPNIGLIGYLVVVRAHQPVRVHRDAVPQGRAGSRHRRDRLPRGRRRGPHVIAQANALGRRAAAASRRSACSCAPAAARSPTCRPSEIDYMDVSPKQIVSVATALIPFLEHDDANRALMGANMQRQAVPLLRATAPFIGTGIEARAARDAGDVVLAEDDGTVVDVAGDTVTVDYKTRGHEVVPAARSSAGRTRAPASTRSRSSTEGDIVKKGDVLADGPSTHQGELALGKNLLVAFMPWKGHNFEDAIVLSERLVRDDVLTSIHIEEHEIDARDTKLGAEEITRDIPNLSEDILKDLDERGIIRIGAEVGPGDILVGKVTPKGETELTPEERLLRAIFGEKAREVRDTSLKVPHGETGKVIDVRVFSARRRSRAAAGRQPARAGLRRAEAQDLRGRQARRPPRQQGCDLQDPPGRGHAVPRRRHAGRHRAQPARCPEPDERRPGARSAPRLRGRVTAGATNPSTVRSPNKTSTITEPAVWISTPVFDGAHWDEADQAGTAGHDPEPARRAATPTAPTAEADRLRRQDRSCTTAAPARRTTVRSPLATCTS